MRPLLRPQPALSLALLRVVVAALMPLAPGFREGARVAAWAPERWIAPEGLGWFVRHVPINGTLATAAQIIVAFSALCAIVGVRARLCFGVLAVAGFYLFAIAQLAGHVFHDNHLLWFCALLAASPCADVLAVDARRPLAAEGREYALPLLAVWLLLGAIYFFPGLHKLLTSGLDWALSDNLRFQLYWKWAQYGVVPAPAPRRVPVAAAPGRAVRPRLRAVVRAAGAVSPDAHRGRRGGPGVSPRCRTWSSDCCSRASGSATWRWWTGGRCSGACFLARRGRPRNPNPRVLFQRRRLRPTIIVGALLLVGAVVQGARGQMRSYPFSCYPTFQWMAAREMPDLMIVVVDDGGRPRERGPRARRLRDRTQRQWAEVWSLAGVTRARGRAAPARVLGRAGAADARGRAPGDVLPRRTAR